MLEIEADMKEPKRSFESLDSTAEKENHSVWLEIKSFRIGLISTFTALAIVLGYMLVLLPNIELFTLTIFLSGFTLGKRDGMIVGLLSTPIFTFFNPIGASPLPLFFYQLIHYTLTGLSGALTKDFFKNKKYFPTNGDLYKVRIMLILGATGMVITTSFQFISSIVSALMLYGTINAFLPYFIIGLPFTITHIIGNTLGFSLILPGLIQLVHKLLY